jgi:TolB-like protein
MASRGRLKIGIFLIILLAFLASCSQKRPNIIQLAPLPDSICRVAVLPFINRTSYQDGDVVFYRVFLSMISEMNEFDIVPEGDIRRIYRQIRVAPGLRQPTYDQMRIIGDYLNADILISGTILQMKENVRSMEDIPYMTVNMEILDADSGTTIWSIYHDSNGEQYRKIMHFGLINTITQLTKQFSQEVLASWAAEGFKGKCLE